MQGYKDNKNQGNMTLPKEHNKILVTDAKELESYKLSDKSLQIIVLKNDSKLQGNTGNQLNEIRGTVQEQHCKFNEEIKSRKEPNRNFGT